ncbi:MAG: hypothetical protein M5U26_15050 [Planctomycetota bacterium]|nr:hypothetical protein [Planctomycetota bacterium]
MPEPAAPGSTSNDSASGRLRGPRFDAAALEALHQDDRGAVSAPTWRGWAVGVLSVAALCKIIPVTDYVLCGTRMTLNVLPFSAIFAVFGLVLLCNLLVWAFRGPLKLTRQDIVLVFCMTMVANHLPGHGFMSYLAAETTGVYYYAAPENQWDQLVHPHIPEGFAPRDPEDPHSAEPRPIEWLYTGLPKGQEIPWGAWLGPYARWAVMMLALYGLLFAVCGLLRRQWSEHEKLPFPLAQVPDEILAGTGSADPRRTSFMRDSLAWWGVGLVFALQSWNAMQDYWPTWPEIPLRNQSFGWEYLTEPPLRHLNPVWFVIYPSIIGLTFLISTEISFSLWFFYLLLKLGVLIAVMSFGMGQSHQEFMYSTKGWQGTFINQGTGALIAMVLAGVWMARGHLKHSLRQALGLEEGGGDAGEEGLSPRALWGLLACCFAGLVAWLVWFQVALPYALLAVTILIVLTTGVMRLISEGGIFYSQVMTSPIEMSTLLAPPATMGAASFVPLSMWSRIAVFDYYRLAPTIPLITAMQVGTMAAVKRRPLYLGLLVSVVLTLVLGFFGFFSSVYRAEGGGNQAGWVFQAFPRGEFGAIAKRVSSVASYEKKAAALAADGKRMPNSEVPEVALRDGTALSWIAAGMAMMFLFVLLRTRVFWWPHPIGYVVWTGQRAISLMWFSFLIGWLIKVCIVKYGGLAVYQRWKRFFVGMIAGEAVAAIFWTALNWFLDHKNGHVMHFN